MSPSKRKKKIAIFSGIGLAIVIVVALVAMKARANGNQERCDDQDRGCQYSRSVSAQKLTEKVSV